MNKVYKNYQTFTCNQPGKYQSTCSNTISPILQETCANGCENGKCIVNTKPKIMSTPVTNVNEQEVYTYQVTATDSEQTVLWFTDDTNLFSINPLTGLIKFTPTKANVGTHSVKITVSDGWEMDSQTYALTISEINLPPVLTSIGALSTREDGLFTKTIIATDPEKLPITFSDNTNLFNIGSSTGLISFTPTTEDVGAHTITITASDGKLTTSETFTLTVLAKEIVNTAPTIMGSTPSANPTITELQQQTFTITATDKESVPGITWYANNKFVGSGTSYTFVGDNSIANSNAGIYTIKAVVSDGELSVQKLWTLNVLRVKDTDTDGVADEQDNCVFVANTNQQDSDSDSVGDACDGNIDGDAVPDEDDFIAGTADVVDTNVKLTLNIGGEENLNKVITGVQPVVFTSTVVDEVTQEVKSEPIVDFHFDFTEDTKLDLSKIEIKTQSEEALAGEVIVRGIDLTAQQQTKTVYMDRKAGTDTICIKDAEIASIKEISSACTGANEYLINCNGQKYGDYTCTIEGAKYKVEGLKHSGVLESRPNNAPSSFITISPQIVKSGNTITLNGYGTDSDDDNIAGYEWDLGEYDSRAQKIIFVTSGSWAAGNLGGLAGADAKCQAEADDAGLLGTYKSFLSANDKGYPTDRCSSTLVVKNRLTVYDNYFLTDGTLIGSLSSPRNSVNKDAAGNLVSGSSVSYTRDNLCAESWDDKSGDCADWTDDIDSRFVGLSVGDIIAGVGTNYFSCREQVHLYCVQQDDIQNDGIVNQQSPSVRLTEPGDYDFKFRVQDEKGMWSSVTSVKITVTQVINHPTNVNAVDKPNDDGKAVNVKFSLPTENTEITKYNVYSSINNDAGTASFVKSVNITDLSVQSGTATIEVNVLDKSARYYWVSAGSEQANSELAGPNLAVPIDNTVPMREDLNGNREIDILDIAIVSQIFATSSEYDPTIDLNSDGEINVLDIATIATVFGQRS